jgi:hypothetical protein
MRLNSKPFKLLSGVMSDPGRKFPHNEEVKEFSLHGLTQPERQSRYHSGPSFSASNELLD